MHKTFKRISKKNINSLAYEVWHKSVKRATTVSKDFFLRSSPYLN